MEPIGYIFFAFGAVLSFIGILVFIKMGTQGTSTVKMFNFEFQLGGSALVIFIVGAVLFMVPIIFDDIFFAKDTVRTIEITPRASSIKVGERVRLTATLRNEKGSLIRNKPILWASRTPRVASVSQSGEVIGKSEGSAVITAESGNAKGEADIEVKTGRTMGPDTAHTGPSRGSSETDRPDVQKHYDISGLWNTNQEGLTYRFKQNGNELQWEIPGTSFSGKGTIQGKYISAEIDGKIYQFYIDALDSNDDPVRILSNHPKYKDLIIRR